MEAVGRRVDLAQILQYHGLTQCSRNSRIVHRCLDGPNARMGLEEAQGLPKGTRKQVSEEEHHDSVHLVEAHVGLGDIQSMAGLQAMYCPAERRLAPPRLLCEVCSGQRSFKSSARVYLTATRSYQSHVCSARPTPGGPRQLSGLFSESLVRADNDA
jgi:hypothetical protein